MASRERYLDPPAEYDSGSEGEGPAVTINTHTEEQLNNNKVHLPSSPGFVAFLRNDVGVGGDWSEGGGGWRRGGPLCDRPPNNQAQPETRRCVSCNGRTSVWHSGERFQCDGWYADEPEQLVAHNQLCEECATDETRCSQCPVHPGSYYKDDVDEDRPPEVVWRADS